MARRRRNPPSTQRDGGSSQTAGSSSSHDSSGENLPAIVRKEIDQELSQLEPQLGPQTRVNVRQSMVRIAHDIAEFSGPLPPPSCLREYDIIIAGAADRIISMAEAEQKHRHSWERSALNNTTIGLWFGFLIALGLVGGGVYSVYVGQPYVAGGFLTAGAIGMVPALIRGKDFVVQRQRDRNGPPIRDGPDGRGRR
jgi:uncharacterized membrane protein